MFVLSSQSSLGSLEGCPNKWRNWRRILRTAINIMYALSTITSPYQISSCISNLFFIFCFYSFPSFWFSISYCIFPWMQNEQYCAKLQKSNERTLALIKAGMDIVVAVGLLQLAPKKVTPRVTGGFGFVSSVISCYQVIAFS